MCRFSSFISCSALLRLNLSALICDISACSVSCRFSSTCIATSIILLLSSAVSDCCVVTASFPFNSSISFCSDPRLYQHTYIDSCIHQSVRIRAIWRPWINSSASTHVPLISMPTHYTRHVAMGGGGARGGSPPNLSCPKPSGMV